MPGIPNRPCQQPPGMVFRNLRTFITGDLPDFRAGDTPDQLKPYLQEMLSLLRLHLLPAESTAAGIPPAGHPVPPGQQKAPGKHLHIRCSAPPDHRARGSRCHAVAPAGTIGKSGYSPCGNCRCTRLSGNGESDNSRCYASHDTSRLIRDPAPCPTGRRLGRGKLNRALPRQGRQSGTDEAVLRFRETISTKSPEATNRYRFRSRNRIIPAHGSPSGSTATVP